MNALQRSGPNALRHAVQSTSRRVQRRFAHAESHSKDAHGPATESMGAAFWFSIALVPAGYLLYTFSRPGAERPNPITAAMAAYADFQDAWQDRNALHTRAVEAAAHDRNLFTNTPIPAWVDLRFPESFSGGSRINVPAGNGTANLDTLVAHYRDKQFKDEEEKRKLMSEGKLPVQLKSQQGKDGESA